MTAPIPTSNGASAPRDIIQFGRSPKRDYISFGSVGKPGIFLGPSNSKRRSFDGLTEEERRDLLEEEEELLEDNQIIPKKKRSYSRSYGSLVRSESVPEETSPLVPVKSRQEEEEIIKNAWNRAIAEGAIQTTYKRESLVLLRNTLPVSLAFLLQYSLTVVSIFSVGHLGKTELSAVSLAAMIANISGYGLFQGISTCLDTVAAQSYGRGELEMVGVYTQRCTILLAITTVPVLLIWVYSKPFLLAFIPEVECCELASQYLKILSFGIPPYVIFEISKHYLQAQGIFHANTYVLLICAPINVILNYLLVWDEKIGLGFIGAPIAVVLTDYLLVIFTLIYVVYIDGYQCWNGWSKESLKNWGYMTQLAFSGVVTTEAEWLAFEVLTFAAARLGTTELATQTVLSSVCVLCYQIPMGMGIAASTRIGNLVGAGLGNSASKASNTAMMVAVVFGSLNALVLFLLRDKVGALFSNDSDVIKMTAEVLPYGAMYQVNDSLAAVTGGLLRGQGRQKISGYVNLLFYYVFALPLGLFLCFYAGWRLVGLWVGICVALVLVSAIQILVVTYANWDDIIQKSQEEFEHEVEIANP